MLKVIKGLIPYQPFSGREVEKLTTFDRGSTNTFERNLKGYGSIFSF